LVEEMPYDEFLGWMSYFEIRPIGWREDDRAAKMIQAQGVKEKPWRIFGSLDVIYNKRPRNEDGTDMHSLKNSSLLQKLSEAKAGAAIQYD
jgi:hypothetical protein